MKKIKIVFTVDGKVIQKVLESKEKKRKVFAPTKGMTEKELRLFIDQFVLKTIIPNNTEETEVKNLLNDFAHELRKAQ